MNKIQNYIKKSTNIAAALISGVIFIFAPSGQVFADSATLSAKASANSVQINKTFTLTISVSADEPVSGISACLAYDAAKVQLTNTSYGSWSTTAPNDGTCGGAHQVSVFTLIANPPSSGTVATLTFRAKVSSGSATFDITGSSVVGAKDNGANILTSTSDDSINFAAAPAPPSGGGSSGGGSSGGNNNKPEPTDDGDKPDSSDESNDSDDSEDDQIAAPVNEETQNPTLQEGESAQATSNQDGGSNIAPFIIAGISLLVLAGGGVAGFRVYKQRQFKPVNSGSAAVSGAYVGGTTPPVNTVAPGTSFNPNPNPNAGFGKPVNGPSSSNYPPSPPKIQ